MKIVLLFIILELGLIWSNMASIGNGNKIDKTQFTQFCQQHFLHKNESVTLEEIDSLFDEMDVNNKNGLLEHIELARYKKWSNILKSPKNALLIIDVQNDFIDGPLSIGQGPAKQNPRDIVPAINKILEEMNFDLIVYSLDWHPANHISFIDNVNLRRLDSQHNNTTPQVFDTVHFAEPEGVEQQLWPRHCVQNTTGAMLHSDLKFINNDKTLTIYKGDNPERDSYSAFYDNQRRSNTPLNDELKKRNITDVYACGLAYDYCVTYTSLDALDLGYKTALLKNQTRGLDFNKMEECDLKIQSKGGIVIENDDELKQIITRNKIPFQWAIYVWKNLDKF